MNQLSPNQDEYHLRDEAAQWGYTRFAYEMALPWWGQRIGAPVIDELVDQSRLTTLLQHQPPCTLAVIAADDPFNTADDLQEIKATAPKLPLFIAPRGGHLGYIGEDWTKAKLLSLFECGAAADGKKH